MPFEACWGARRWYSRTMEILAPSMAKMPSREAANEIWLVSVRLNFDGDRVTNLVVFEDVRCIEAIQTSPESYINGSLAKNAHHQRQELDICQWQFLLVIQGNTDRSAKITNIVSVEPLLVNNSNGSPRSHRNQREASKTPRHNNDDSTVIGRGQRDQRRQRVGRHDAELEGWWSICGVDDGRATWPT